MTPKEKAKKLEDALVRIEEKLDKILEGKGAKKQTKKSK